MKYAYISLILCLFTHTANAQWELCGRVINSEQEIIEGATIEIKNTNKKTKTDSLGEFALIVDAGDTLSVAHIGFQPYQIGLLNRPAYLELTLISSVLEIEEVDINTGYYRLPKERSTGSFSIIGKEELERGTSTSLLERLEGMVTSISLDRFAIEGEKAKETDSFQIRGFSTIESNQQPLIILDDVPYGGELSTIDPNSIESITLLKDAAAASIWGARAGNGVVVINTKRGRLDQEPQISLRSSIKIGDKPDLFYDKKFLPATEIMAFEKELFANNSYPERDQTALPLYVEYLIANRDRNLTDNELADKEVFLSGQDTRRSALDNFYRRSSNQQFALNISGGGHKYAYSINGTFGKNNDVQIGRGRDRKGINISNTFRLWSTGEIFTTANYSVGRSSDNSVTYSDLGILTYKISPYLNLIDEQGNPASIPYGYRSTYQDKAIDNGLLDWRYRPLEEMDRHENNTFNQEVRFSISLKQKLIKNLNLRLLYNYRRSNDESLQHAKKDSYFVRNLVNRFTQQDGEQIIPEGGIMTNSGNRLSYDNIGRLQFDYEWLSDEKHALYALAGGEIREGIIDSGPQTRLYGYDEKLRIGTSTLNFNQSYSVRPTGSARINTPVGYYALNTDRYLSYFANASYTYKDKYTLSSSLRWDGSNIYGVKANQKGIPLWSLGGGWELSKEPFLAPNLFDYLRIRATLGSSGNSNNTVSAYPIVTYGTDVRTGLRSAALRNPGNPYIKWERVLTTNLGIDFRMLKNRLSGSLEFYTKNSNDLIGDQYLDPTQGLSPGFLPTLANKVNYANLKTKGWDLEVTSRNLIGGFRWSTTFMFSFVRDKVTEYAPSTLSDIQNIATYFYPIARPPVQVGKSLNTLYSFPWYGLDRTGKPQILVDGVQIENFQDYHNNYPVENLVNSGVRVAPYFGSFRNDLSWRSFDLSVLMLWKAGHVFRRASIGPLDEYRNSYHMDYYKRWQNPGDEQHTDVPAAASLSKVNDVQTLSIKSIYDKSEALVTPAAFLRLQDVTLAYRTPSSNVTSVPKNMRVFLQLKNLGLVWRENHERIDPEYPNALYPVPFSCSLGFNIDF